MRLTRKTKKIKISKHLKRLLIFPAILFLLVVSAESINGQIKDYATVTLNVTNITFTQILEKLKNQTSYQFRYSDAILNPKEKYSFNINNKPFTQALKEICDKANVDYKINNNMVSLRMRQKGQKTIDVKGTVSDVNGSPLTGVTVKIDGTSKGVTTDIDGKYTIKDAPSNGELLFSFIGMKQQKKAIDGKPIIDVTLSENSVGLNEVVVTALGLTRDDKSLGYSVTKLNNKEITQTQSSNWLNGLAGKVAGLTFEQAGGSLINSIRVTLRGDQSLNYGSNEALFVVDGVPIYSGTTSTHNVSNYAQDDAPVDFGNGVSDLNSEDIASITVLKGPAATALYGSRAANGAIVITTKSGREKKGIGVTLNSSLTVEKAGYFPNFQTEYGNGSDMGLNEYSLWNLTSDMTSDGSTVSRNYSRYTFGEKFDANKTRYLYSSKNWDTNTYTKMPWIYQDDWYTGIFQTGVTLNNSVTIDGSNGKGTSTRFSISDARNSWILPNTGYKKQSVSLSYIAPFNKYIKINAKINYYHTGSDNIPNNGYSVHNPIYDLVWGFNVNSINDWKSEYFNNRFNYTNWLTGTGLVFPSSSSYNPYRTLYEETNSSNKDRALGNLALTFNLYKGLTLDLRSSVDATNEFRIQKKPYYTSGYPQGFYREQTIRFFEINNDFMLRYVKNDLIDNRLGMSFMFGGNSMSSNYYNYRITLNELGEEGVYNTTNLPTGFVPDLYNYRSKKAVNSLYGLASFSFDNSYYLDITGRNDWSSTLSKGYWSYFYPSIAGSMLLDQIFEFKKNVPWIDMLKYRLSWANVGNDTSPYSLDQYYSSSSYSGGYKLPGTITNPSIKPENVASWETGVAANLFDNRISFDIATYYSSTTNQIVSVDIDQITGATGMKINAGEITNRGLEISATLIPIKTKNFTWSFDANWATNKNKLVKLQDGWNPDEPLQTDMGTTIGSRVYIYSYVGQEMNVIYGRGYQRAPKGAFYLDSDGNKIDASGMILVNSSGYPILDNSPTTKIGKVNPDWRGGITQHFKYKNLTFSAIFTAQMGGHAYSVTNFSLSYQGKLKNSLEGRYDGLVINGVQSATDDYGSITYTKNTTVTPSIQTYYNTYVWNRDNVETNTFSTDFLKLREIRLEYQLPKKFCQYTKIIQNGSVSAYATNIFCITNFPQYDPEAAMLNGSDIHSGIEAMSFPMTRTYGFNFNLAF